VIISLSFVIAESQTPCPDGWFPRTLIVYDFPNCTPIIVNFCVYCPVSSGELKFQINEIKLPPECSGFYLPSFMDYLSARILANYFEFCTGTWRPCSQPPKQIVSIRKPLCFYESDEQQNDFLFCDGSWCVEVYEVCVENNLVDWDLVDKYISGNPNPECINTQWNENLPPGTCFHVIDCY